MRAAIYARKSTDQAGVADDQKSVARQIAHGTAFAREQGWTVDDAHVYADDGVSGAIFGEGRPALLRLLNALKPRPAFDVLVMSEESRLGREMHQTAHVFGEIIRAGVRVFFYLDRRERTLDTAIDKMMLTLTAFGSEIEREKARQRTKDALLRKAKAGHVTGGRVFGYDNVRLADRVERRIHPAEAAVVRRIFTLVALGEGHRGVAHLLNQEGLPAPRPQQGRPGGWSPSTIRAVLERALYRGVIEWDRARRDGERRQLRRGRNAQPIRVDAPHLRIVPEELAAAVDAIRAVRREQYVTATGTLIGNPDARAVKYLLTGLLRCACGATFEAQGGQHGKRAAVYLCSAARRKGRAICASTVHLPIADTDAQVLDVIDRELLNPEVLGYAVDLSVAMLLARNTPDPKALARERAQLDRELANLAGAIAAGGEVPTLLAEIRKREDRRRSVERAIERERPNARSLRADLESDVWQWKTWLHGTPVQAQRALRTVLDGPIRIGAPTDIGVPWEALGSLSGVLTTWSSQVASSARRALTGGVGPHGWRPHRDTGLLDHATRRLQGWFRKAA